MRHLSALGILSGMAALAAIPAMPQQNFRLDTTFRTDIVQQNVNSLVLLQSGNLLLSGMMRFPGDMSTRGSMRLFPNGSRDVSFPSFPFTVGSGKLVLWNSGYYVNVGNAPRKLDSEGLLDPSFIALNLGPYILSQQGGDYHVFPDGRVLLTGQYLLSDTARGFVGQYTLVWLTNTGYLDTTRVHHQANGPMWNFTEMPDGKFVCACTCSQYDGQPVDKLFRVEADGSLDTSFHSGVNYGNVYAYAPLADGRCIIGGNFGFTQLPGAIFQLVRLMPDGSMDETFHNDHQFEIGELTGIPKPVTITPWGADKFFVPGHYRSVDGLPRSGICVVDSSGELLPYFENCTAGTFTYYGQTAASFVGVAPAQDSTSFYIWGTFVGFNDGMVNDTSQRFISRVYLEDTPTVVQEKPTPVEHGEYRIQPNPARGWAAFNYDRKEIAPENGLIIVREITGRVVATLPMQGPIGQQVWDTRGVSPGVYMVEFRSGGHLLHTEKLIVQQ